MDKQTALALLKELAELGVKLSIQDGQLALDAPKGVLSGERVARIRTHKSELLALLDRLEQESLELTATPADDGLGLLPGLAQQADPPPLSFAQQRFWLLHQLQPESAQYHIQLALDCYGALDLKSLNGAYQALLERHAILRTAYGQQRAVAANAEDSATGSELPPQLLIPQQLHIEQCPAIQYLDLSQHAHPRAAADQAALELNRQPFALAREMPARALLIRLPDEAGSGRAHHQLYFCFHHIAVDAWSLQILVTEFGALYRQQGLTPALSAAELPAAAGLAPLDLSYADFACWQQQRMQAGELDQQLDYWRQQLQGLPPRHGLPLDFPRPPTQQTPLQQAQSGLHRQRLAPELLQALKQRAQGFQVSLFMLLQAALNLVLHAYGDSDEVVVGTAVAGRPKAALEGLVGCFVNTLVLRSRIDENQDFPSYLADLRETILAAFQHQDLPFERLVEELQPPRQLGINPLFQICFTLQNLAASNAEEGFSLPRLHLDGLEMQPLRQAPGAPKFDLDIAAQEQGGALVLGWEYHAGIFAAASVERWAESFAAVLSAVAADPRRSLSALLASHSERQLAELAALTGTRGSAPELSGQALHQAFQHHARQHPDALALVAEDDQGEQRWTYAQLDELSNRLAQDLRRLCRAAPERRVALLLPRGAERIISILAVWKSGAAYVPLDPAHPPARLAQIVEDVAPVALIHGGQALTPAPRCAQFSFQQWCQAAEREPNLPPALDYDPQQAAYVLYTSGSTGTPKGVVVSHANLDFFQHSFHQLLSAQGVDLRSPRAWNAAYTFDVSLEAIASLCYGAPLAVVPQAARTDRARLSAFLQRHGAEVMDITPSQLEPLLGPGDVLPAPVLVVAGEAISADLWQRLARAPGPAWAQHPPVVFNGYGPTEATVLVAATRIQRELPCQLGAAFPGLQFSIMDAAGRVLPPGAVGELYCAGPALARGYWQRPALTAERFVPAVHLVSDPDSSVEASGVRFYRSGDKVRWRPEGGLEYLGRMDQQLKLRGYRIEAGEIVAALHSVPGITQAAVRLCPPPRVGDGAAESTRAGGDGLLVAYYCAEREISAESLRQQLAQRLPAYMLPTAWVALKQLPLNRSGKLDLAALPPPQWPDQHHEAPRDALEARLCALFAQLLGHPQVDPRSDFFSLGGHSLLAIRLSAALEQEWQHKIDLRQIFETPSPRALAHYLQSLARGDNALVQRGLAESAEQAAVSASSAQPAAAERESDESLEIADGLTTDAAHADMVALSYAQHRFWMLQALAPEDSRYHLPLALELTGSLDLCALQGALDTLLARHEILRTLYPHQDLVSQDAGQFQAVQSQAAQSQAAQSPAAPLVRAQILEQAQWPLRYWDLPASAELAGISQDEQLRQLSENFLRQPFALAQELPLRAALVRLSDDQHRLYLVFHHIAVDGWSLGILLEEFCALYPAWRQLGRERALAANNSPRRLAPSLAGTVMARGGACHYDCTSTCDRQTALGLARLEALPARYQDFARWQQRQLGHGGDLRYWRQQLAGIPPRHSLALDFPRTGAGLALTLSRQLPLASLQGLRQLCQRQGASLFMGLQTLLASVVLRFSGAPEVLIGTPVSQRQQARWQGLVGCFVNSLALRHRFSLEQDFASALELTRTLCLDAVQHQQLPFEALVEALEIPRQAHANPLFQIMLDVLESSAPSSPGGAVLAGAELAGLQLKPLASPPQHSKMDLQLSVEEGAEGLKLRWNYDSGLFLASTIQRLADAFEQLLAAVLQQPQLALAQLLQARPEELPYGHPPSLPLRPFQALHQRLRQCARQYPQRLALLEEVANGAAAATLEPSVADLDSAQSDPVAQLVAARLARPRDQLEARSAEPNPYQVKRWTFAQVDELSDQLAWLLRHDFQVGPDERVALLLPRGSAQIFALLAVWKCGAAYVPLDPELPLARLRSMLEDVKPSLLLIDEAWAAQQDQSLADTLAHFMPVGIHGLLREARGARPRVALAAILDAAAGTQAHSLAYIIYTSGSTGAPKGVMVSQGNLDYFQDRFAALQRQLGLAPQAVRGWNAAYSFDVSLEGIASLCNGSPLAILPTRARQDSAELSRFVETHGLAFIDFTPSHLEALLQDQHNLPVPCIVLAGEAIHPQLWQRLAQFNRDGARVVNAYGPTETTVIMTATLIDGDPLAHMGPPFAGLPCYVVDEQERLLPAGAVGELLVGGACVTAGYWQRPGLTAQRYLADAHSAGKGQRLYRTGDRVRWRPDGSLEFLGRTDQQVKLHGHRIELEEVEQALLACCEAQAAAAQVHSQADGAVALWAYLVAAASSDDAQASDATPLAQAQWASDEQSTRWRQALAQRLPAAMLPQHFVLLPRLPLNASGKLARTALPQLPLASTAQPAQSLQSARQDGSAANSLYTQLHQLWCQVLGRQQVAPGEDFYSLGGDSIRSIQLVHLARRQGLYFTVVDVLEQRTLSALSACIQARGEAFDAGLALDPGPQGDDDSSAEFPATAMQEWMWQAYQGDSQHAQTLGQDLRRGIFHVQHAYRLRGIRFSESQFRQALGWVLKNPNFRVFFRSQSAPRALLQGLHPEALLDYRHHRWQGLDERAWQEQLDHLLAQDRQRPFQAQGALARFDLAQLSADEWILLFSHHHAIMDGWSHGLFFQQLWQALELIQHGQELPAEPASASHLDVRRYAQQERQWARDGVLAQYWQPRMARWPRWEQTLPQGALAESGAHLDGPVAQRLEHWCQRHQVTPKALFLQAWREALAPLGKIGLGLVSHQRNNELADPLGSLGLFWSLVPLVAERAAVDGGAIRADTGAVAVRELQHQLDELSRYGRYPLDRLQAQAGVDQLFQASYNFVHFHHLAAESFFAQAQPEGQAGSSQALSRQLRFSTLRRQDDFGLPWQCFVSATPGQSHYLVNVAVAAEQASDSQQQLVAQQAAAAQARQLLHRMLSLVQSWVGASNSENSH